VSLSFFSLKDGAICATSKARTLTTTHLSLSRARVDSSGTTAGRVQEKESSEEERAVYQWERYQGRKIASDETTN